jgi:O-succinylbenzoate synthase
MNEILLPRRTSTIICQESAAPQHRGVIYRFAHRRYRLPLHPPLRTAHGPWGEREGILVRLEDEAGRVGYGEIAPIPWFGTETLVEAEEICRKFAEKIAGEALDAVPDRFGCVRFALATARVPAASTKLETRVPLTALLPAGRGAIEVLLARLDAGWLSFKWKVGVGAPDEELGLLDELLERLPAYAKLRLDANGSWSRRQAVSWLERCAERPVEFIEQPVAPADVDSLMGLARDYPVKLALDESVVRLDEARQWQARGWPGVFVIKPALAGPLEETADWFAQTRPDVVLSSSIETAVGRAAIWEFVLRNHPDLLKRSPGFGVGEIFGDRRWDGPFVGPILDGGWSRGVNPEELWNALA